MRMRHSVPRTEADDRTPDLDRMYREEAPRLARYFRRHRRDDDVSDLVQETFTRLLSARVAVRCAKPRAYLQRIARNLLFDRSRQASSRSHLSCVEMSDQLGLSTPAEQSQAIDHADTMRLYRGALAELPARTREAFLLHRVGGFTYKEIAIRLGVSVPTVQYHIARALVHIDKALEQG